MYLLAGAIAAAGLLYLAFRNLSRLTGEEERIRTFLRVYQGRRNRGASERQAMEAVCELRIPP